MPRIEKIPKKTWSDPDLVQLLDDDGNVIISGYSSINIHGKYFVATKEKRNNSVIEYSNQLYKFGDKEPLSPELRWISNEGVLNNESIYYVGQKEENEKRVEAIFSINSRKPITSWYDSIYQRGVVKGQSKYYLVSKNKLEAICNIKQEDPITDWFDSIEKFGDQNDVVDGKTNFFIGSKNKKCYLIHINNGIMVELKHEKAFHLLSGVLSRLSKSDPSKNEIQEKCISYLFEGMK